MFDFLLPVFFASYGFLLEFFESKKRKKEYRELSDFSDFLADVIDEFYLCKSITESIFRACQKVRGELKETLLKLCFSLEEEDAEFALYEQKLQKHLKFVKLFYLQCVNAIQFGCGRKGEETVFVRNITELRRDVMNECTKRTQAGFLFSGFGVIAVAPALFPPLVKAWGMKNMPELITFYEGFSGRMVTFSFYVLLVVSYLGLRMVKQVDEIVYQRKKPVEWFFHLSFFQKLSGRAVSGKLEHFGRVQLNKLGLQKNGMEYFISCFFTGSLLAVAVRILSLSERNTVSLFAALSSFLIGFAGMMGVYAYLSYLRRIGMSGETLSLQSVILLLFEAPNMTIAKLLMTMEDCAVIFKRALQHCTDRYSSEEREALQLLCKAESFLPFRQLANRLVISERLGLQKAFCELSSDRSFFREQQRLDTEQEIRKKAANAQIIAFIPMFFLLFAYLILPFLSASLSQMGDIFSEMNQMKTT